MFGYVNVFRDELKIKDYNIFKAYYCGLCKSLGKNYNQIVRLGLSYDMTFLAILSDSIGDCEPQIVKEGCIKHVGKQNICINNKAIDYSSDMSILMTYHKLSDDIIDDKSIKARFAKIPYYIPFRKASKKYSDISRCISECMTDLRNLEYANCGSIDEVSDCFARLLKKVFEGFDSSLGNVGYNIGRFIYVIDAYNDIEKDYKNKSYNPYICFANSDLEKLENIDFKNRVMGSLNMTLNALSESYSKLNIQRNKAILDNIIYLGLRNKFEKTFRLV